MVVLARPLPNSPAYSVLCASDLCVEAQSFSSLAAYPPPRHPTPSLFFHTCCQPMHKASETRISSSACAQTLPVALRWRSQRSSVRLSAIFRTLGTFKRSASSHCGAIPLLFMLLRTLSLLRQKSRFSAHCFQALAHSSKMCMRPTPSASAICALFAKNTRVGGTPCL